MAAVAVASAVVVIVVVVMVLIVLVAGMVGAMEVVVEVVVVVVVAVALIMGVVVVVDRMRCTPSLGAGFEFECRVLVRKNLERKAMQRNAEGTVRNGKPSNFIRSSKSGRRHSPSINEWS